MWSTNRLPVALGLLLVVVTCQTLVDCLRDSEHRVQLNRNQVQQHRHDEIQQQQIEQQQVVDVNEQEGLPQVSDSDNKPVIPSIETNANSQVVFVNFTRVVNDGLKNETTRIVDGPNLIKQNGEIACGEMNRNGRPSMSAETVNNPLPNRIVGGTKADPGEFPFQVRLNIRSRRGSSLCGGVIIDQRHILTAAHCMTTW